MADIIQLLPDSVANQIAAGEVVQRPASVIKELVENAIDAGATEIIIKVVDSGRTSIQIIDNGCGMSETDARMAFEKHATSKIRTAEDIFQIRSLGFRGEALASIAAVAHVELKTQQEDAEFGTEIKVKGSVVESQEPVSFKKGSSFLVKNIYYNIPARRKFLKSNQTEFKYILAEIYHTALAHIDITFSIYKDNELYAKYPKSSLKQRIVSVFGKRYEKTLLSVETETSIVKVYGFVTTPELCKKNNFDQYLFVNNRHFKQRSFQAAVLRAYDKLICPNEYPSFYLFLDVDPAQIDVNIHPTKTEIKFVEEYNICQIIEAAVKHTLGKSNIVPSMDFMDDYDYSDMFDAPKPKEIRMPSLTVNPSYNPFNSSKTANPIDDDNLKNWEKLFNDFENTPEEDLPQQTFQSALNTQEQDVVSEQATCFQIQKKYIVTQGKSGLLIIDIKRAHSRILFESFLKHISSGEIPIQKTLFPISIETNNDEFETIQEILPELQFLGFDIEVFGKNAFVVNGCPDYIDVAYIEQILRDFICDYSENQRNLKEDAKIKIAKIMAKNSALYRNVVMQQDEMQSFIAQLFCCESHSLSAEGKLAVILLEYDEIFKKFN